MHEHGWDMQKGLTAGRKTGSQPFLYGTDSSDTLRSVRFQIGQGEWLVLCGQVHVYEEIERQSRSGDITVPSRSP